MTRERGFSLVEAAVAVGVVAILGGIIYPLVWKTITDARIARARHDVKVIADALVAQMKDTGSRPMADGGPGGCDGRRAAYWYSSLRLPWHGPASLPTPQDPHAANRLTRLFCAQGAELGRANALFGLGAGHPRDRYRYRGPYLTEAAAGQSDPWGNAYLVLGYNAFGQRDRGPIWVVSAGPGGRVAPDNLGGPRMIGVTRLPAVWDYRGDSQGNIALRVQ
jgi:type II secretory pathway pseudopilin PulG